MARVRLISLPRGRKGLRKLIIWSIGCLASLIVAQPLQADVFTAGDRIQAYFAPYTFHYHPSPDHNPWPWFVGLEWESADRWEIGGDLFRNSFYQPCGYLYGGKRFIFGSEEQHLFFKLTAGGLFGYVQPYDQNIPVNSNGIGLGVIPAIGYKYKRFSSQLAILGGSALMATFGYDFWL